MSSEENLFYGMGQKREKMSSSGVGPEDPRERIYRVEEIERIRWEEEKKQQEKNTREEPSDGIKPGLAACLMLFLDKVIGFIKQLLQTGLIAAATEPARKDLLLIKSAFEMMMREDRSQDALFLKNLSKLWQRALEHSIRLQTTSSLGKGLKALIKDIENYPQDTEHTFGYYLDEFAGQKWLPFPYMELLQEMHRKHELNPPSSLFTRWTNMIEEILNLE